VILQESAYRVNNEKTFSEGIGWGKWGCQKREPSGLLDDVCHWGVV